jgi:hypothetical protein
MKKEIYLIKETERETYKQFSQRILALSKKVSADEKTEWIKTVFTGEPPPKVSVIPFKKQKIAAISIYSTKKERVEMLINEPGFAGGYVVEEAIPVAYEKSWEDGTATPGVCLLTLFRRKPGIDTKTFIDRWHNSHTPLSLEIHPLWNYNRNVVGEKLTNTSDHWEGIVEEHFRTKSDLLNPVKFFGNPFVMIYNMLRVYLDTKSFLDYKTIEPYFATEIWIKS